MANAALRNRSAKTISQIALRKFVALSTILLAFSACENRPEREALALRQDIEALSQLSRIDSQLESAGSISPEDFGLLKRIREKYPNSASVRQVYQNALVIREDWAALEVLFAGRPLSDLTAEDRRTLGKVYIKSGKYQQAIDTVKPLSQTDPNDLETNYLLVNSLFHLDRLGEAAALIDSMWDRILAEQRIEEITIRGIIYMRQNDLPKAIETLKKATEISPSAVAPNNVLSQVYAQAGDTKQAEFYRSRTVELNDKSTANTRMASRQVQQIYALHVAWKSRDYPKTIELAKQILPTAEDKNQKLVLYQYLFESYKAMGDEREANDALNKARELQGQK